MWKYKFSKLFNKVNTTIAAIRDFGMLVFTHVCTCMYMSMFFRLKLCHQSKNHFKKRSDLLGLVERPLWNIHGLQKYNWLPLNRFCVCPFPCGQKVSGESFRRCFQKVRFTWWVLHAGVWWHCLIQKDCSQQVGCTTLYDPQHDQWKLLTSGSMENSCKNMSKWWKSQNDDVQRECPLQIFQLPGPLGMRWPTIFDHPRNPPGVPNAPMPFTCG